MSKIIIGTTKLPEDVIEELKKKTGEKTIKDALAKAIDHYLMCFKTKEMEKESKKVKKIDNKMYAGEIEGGKAANYD